MLFRSKEVAREHKKKEKELVKEGKKPFFLKKCMSMTLPTSTVRGLTMFSSRAKEDCFGRPLPEYEIEAARQGHRTPSQEGCCQRKEEYARCSAHCMIDIPPVRRMRHSTRINFRYPASNAQFRVISNLAASCCSVLHIVIEMWMSSRSFTLT